MHRDYDMYGSRVAPHGSQPTLVRDLMDVLTMPTFLVMPLTHCPFSLGHF